MLRAIVARRGAIVAPLFGEWQRELEIIAKSAIEDQAAADGSGGAAHSALAARWLAEPRVKVCFDDYFEGRADTLIETPWSQVMIVPQGAK